MFIYHLWREYPDSSGFDENYAFVIIAPSETEARSIAMNNCQDEDPAVWRTAFIRLLGVSFITEPQVVVRDAMEG